MERIVKYFFTKDLVTRCCFFFQIIGHIFLFFFQVIEVFFRFCYDDTAQADEGNEVRDSHQTVYDIGQNPDDVEFNEGAAGDEGDKDNAVRHNAFNADQVFNAAFTIVVPAEDGRESKEGKSDAEDDAAVRREGHRKGGIGKRCPVDVAHPGTADD